MVVQIAIWQGSFELSTISNTAKQRSFVQAYVVLPLRALGPYNPAVYYDIHVVFPLRVSAPLAQVGSSHGRLNKNISRFCHVFSPRRRSGRRQK
jgi:hypothetical protein